jgi:hypothetical protein
MQRQAHVPRTEPIGAEAFKSPEGTCCGGSGMAGVSDQQSRIYPDGGSAAGRFWTCR